MRLSRPLRLLAGALVGLPLATAFFDRPLMTEVGSGGLPADVLVVRPGLYTALSPLTATLDALSLLSLSQHIALLVTLLSLFAALRWRSRPANRPLRRAVLVEFGAAGAFLVALVGVYAAMTYLPRPVPALRVTDPDWIVLDFHSHTRASHDVGDRRGPEWNRQVHLRGGFDAAFLTDHGGWGGLAEALALNPERAGDGFVFLPGSELWLGHENTLALGDSSLYAGTLDERRIRILPGQGPTPTQPPATLLLTLPARRPLEAEGHGPDTPWGLVGLEVNDASPKGLEQGRGQRGVLLEVAGRENLALVSGSNNHGAGQTAAAWTLMRLPGWRALDPQGLSSRILATLHLERNGATRVVERTMPFPDPYVAVVLTLPSFLWHVGATLSAVERAVWLIWAGAAWGLAIALRRVRP